MDITNAERRVDFVSAYCLQLHEKHVLLVGSSKLMVGKEWMSEQLVVIGAFHWPNRHHLLQKVGRVVDFPFWHLRIDQHIELCSEWTRGIEMSRPPSLQQRHKSLSLCFFVCLFEFFFCDVGNFCQINFI